jgi:hypothetical protein
VGGPAPSSHQLWRCLKRWRGRHNASMLRFGRSRLPRLRSGPVGRSRFVTVTVAALVVCAACKPSSRTSQPRIPTSSTTVAVVRRGLTHACPPSEVPLGSVMPTPTRMTETLSYGQSLRLGPPPSKYRPLITPAKAWNVWLSQRVPCARRDLLAACSPSEMASSKLLLSTAAWNEGHGYGRAPADAPRIAWAVIDRGPVIDPGPLRSLAADTRTTPPASASHPRCYWVDGFVTIDASTGEEFGGVMGLGAPGQPPYG